MSTTVTVTIPAKINQAIEEYQEAYREATGKRKPTKPSIISWMLEQTQEDSLALLEEKTQALKETINNLKNASL
jgi:hypothetical protein